MLEGPSCRFRREARARERHPTPAVVDSLKVPDLKTARSGEAGHRAAGAATPSAEVRQSQTWTPLFKNLVGTDEERVGYADAKQPCCLKVDCNFHLGRLLHGQIFRV